MPLILDIVVTFALFFSLYKTMYSFKSAVAYWWHGRGQQKTRGESELPANQLPLEADAFLIVTVKDGAFVWDNGYADAQTARCLTASPAAMGESVVIVRGGMCLCEGNMCATFTQDAGFVGFDRIGFNSFEPTLYALKLKEGDQVWVLRSAGTHEQYWSALSGSS